MAKKKKGIQQKRLTPEQYIRQKGRSLPIEACYITADWKQIGEGTVLIVRKHAAGTYTVGGYLIDTYCRGLKDSFCKFSLAPLDYDLLLQKYNSIDLKKIDYVEAHNLIYGCIDFAEEAGIEPDSSFKLTQYLLEEDTEEIPLMEFEFGKDGKHFLVANSQLELSKYLPKVQTALGDGNFKYMVSSDEENFLDLSSRNTMKRLQENLEKTQALPQTVYQYKYPEYPAVLEVKHQHLVPLLYDPKNAYGFQGNELEEILSLPHDELREDLEKIALFEIGQTCVSLPHMSSVDEFHGCLMHVLFLLGELGDNRSLDIVLEVMRQSEEFMDYHFGDSGSETVVPTLYLLGRDRLDDLMRYAKEPGLYTFFRIYLFEAVAWIVHETSERRAEVLEWFREVLVFYAHEIKNTIYCDGILAGMMISNLIDMKAVELLSEIKALYDTGCVDLMSCGDYERVETECNSPKRLWLHEYETDIRERYKQMLRWKPQD